MVSHGAWAAKRIAGHARPILRPFGQFRRNGKITFRVVKETYGWAVRLGEHMTTPFWSKASAVQAAHRFAAALSGHGEYTEVLVESVRLAASPQQISP